MQVRKMIIDFVQSNLEMFKCHLPKDSQTYLNDMYKSGIWGTHTEILALASLLNLNIYTYLKPEGRATYEWHRYKPLGKAKPVNSLNSSPPKSYHIEIVNIQNIHYDRIVPVQGFQLPLSKLFGKEDPMSIEIDLD